jgi:hypothetical protein
VGTSAPVMIYLSGGKQMEFNSRVKNGNRTSKFHGSEIKDSGRNFIARTVLKQFRIALQYTTSFIEIAS